MSLDATEPSAFEPHDHQDCIARTVAEAEAHCAREKLRLTPIRRRVLEILLEEHRAMGAYDVLSRLTAEGLGAHPPLAYRALDFLVSHGFAHRIARLNAFVACGRPGENHRPAFLICRSCNAVAEAQVPAEDGLLGAEAAAMGFTIESASIEVEGICPACNKAD
ncbi:MAG: Fur family transcriptional regulator [Pseudomonadota bacterium]